MASNRGRLEAAAVAVVSDVIHVSGHLEDGAVRVLRPDVVVIDQKEVWWTTPVLCEKMTTSAKFSNSNILKRLLTGAVPSHGACASESRNGIGLIEKDSVRDKQCRPEKRHFGVEVVICHVKSVTGILRTQTWRTLDGTGEIAISRGERRLPHLRKLIQNVRDLDLVGVVVHEYHRSLVRQDHLRESRPVVQTHGDLRRFVGVIDEARVLDGTRKVAGHDEVRIANE